MIEIDPDLFGKKVVFMIDKQQENTTAIIRGFDSDGKGNFHILVELLSGGFRSISYKEVIRVIHV